LPFECNLQRYNASKAVQTFNTCAVTNKQCVKQKQDTGEYPVPDLASLKDGEGFNANVFANKSRWYIVAGLNKDFDIFDCQEHFFSAVDKDHMAVKINWRINRPNGQFYERSDIQTFYADDNSHAVMHNNGNEYLHYQDDWYIPGYKEGEYVFVYYRGTNDAWDGYGGAVVGLVNESGFDTLAILCISRRRSHALSFHSLFIPYKLNAVVTHSSKAPGDPTLEPIK
jgi:violaxanthin de-epoxidase